MKNIKDMINIGKKVGYTIIKNGVDNYTMCENGVIVDFTKPLKIYRELQPLKSSKAYNGVPISLFYDSGYLCSGFNCELWCYLMNKKDNDIIHFDDIINEEIEYCDTYDKIVYNFDLLSQFGYVRETDEYIEIYAYPIQSDMKFSWEYYSKDLNRMAPYKFEE